MSTKKLLVPKERRGVQFPEGILLGERPYKKIDWDPCEGLTCPPLVETFARVICIFFIFLRYVLLLLQLGKFRCFGEEVDRFLELRIRF